MTSVKIQALTKNYGAFQAVKGLDLDIAEGELVVLLGPSGCGKTTTLRCIAGLEDVSGGRILLGDETVSSADYSLPPERRAIGMVFQSYAVWPHMTIRQNVAFGLTLQHMAKSEVNRRVDEVLELVGLGGFADRSVSQLSGGQQQRVALARAVVLEPRVLLFDEPLSNLDAKLRERMRFELRNLQKRLGITAVYVTHDQQEAMAIADRVVLMNSGQIEQMGAPDEIYNRPVTRFAAEFIGLTNILEGKVVGLNPTLIELDNGLKFVAAAEGFQIGERVEVISRPENIKLLSAPSDEKNTYAGQVSNFVFLGNTSEIFVDIGGTQIRCQSSPPVIYPIGQQIWIQMAPDGVIVLHKSA